MNDPSFESPISELLDLVIKVGVAISKRLSSPLELKSTNFSKIDFMSLNVQKF